MISIIISTYNQNKHIKSVLISKFNDELNDNLLKKCQLNKHIKLIYKNEIDHYVLFLFLITLKQSPDLYSSYIQQFIKFNSANLIIKYNLNDTPIYPLSINWNYKIAELYFNKLKLDVGFSWLSTIGGAYHTLGYKIRNFAFKAAIISGDQLKLSLLSGDPYTITRCLIYNTYSLIQRDQIYPAFKLLKYIIYPYIKRNYYGRRMETEEFKILKGMYRSASDHYYFKRDYLKKLNSFKKEKKLTNGLNILNNIVNNRIINCIS